MKNITITCITTIAFAIPAPAAEPAAEPEAKPAAELAAELADGDDAKQLEKQMIGYWVPDAEAMIKLFVEKKIMSKEDAQALTGESSEVTFHVELGTVHMYSDQGILDLPYELLAADKATGMLMIREVNSDRTNKGRAFQLLIKGAQITVIGIIDVEGKPPFTLKKIDEAEFAKRKAASIGK